MNARMDSNDLQELALRLAAFTDLLEQRADRVADITEAVLPAGDDGPPLDHDGVEPGLELVDHGPCRGAVHVGQHDRARAVRREAAHEGGTDAAAGTGDDDVLGLQVHGAEPTPRMPPWCRR